MCRKSRLKTFMKIARIGEMIAAKAYGRATKLAQKADCQDAAKTINALSKSEIAHANLCSKAIEAINTPKDDVAHSSQDSESSNQ